MTMNMKTKLIITLLPAALCLAACDVNRNSPDPVPDPVPEWISIETYAGGELGTTFNVSASAFEDPTPAVENAGLEQEFKHGELIFEHNRGTGTGRGRHPTVMTRWATAICWSSMTSRRMHI